MNSVFVRFDVCLRDVKYFHHLFFCNMMSENLILTAMH